MCIFSLTFPPVKNFSNFSRPGIKKKTFLAFVSQVDYTTVLEEGGAHYRSTTHSRHTRAQRTRKEKWVGAQQCLKRGGLSCERTPHGATGSTCVWIIRVPSKTRSPSSLFCFAKPNKCPFLFLRRDSSEEVDSWVGEVLG